MEAQEALVVGVAVVVVHHQHLLVLQQAVVGVAEAQVGQVVEVEAVVEEALVVQVGEEVVHHQAQAHHPQAQQRHSHQAQL